MNTSRKFHSARMYIKWEIVSQRNRHSGFVSIVIVRFLFIVSIRVKFGVSHIFAQCETWHLIVKNKSEWRVQESCCPMCFIVPVISFHVHLKKKKEKEKQFNFAESNTKKMLAATLRINHFSLAYTCIEYHYWASLIPT